MTSAARDRRAARVYDGVVRPHLVALERGLFALAIVCAGATATGRAAPQLSPSRRFSVDQANAQVPQGSYWPALTPDAKYVAFMSYAALVPADTNGVGDVYLCDLPANSPPQLISVGLAGGAGAFESRDDIELSADGRFVAFWSAANDLVAGDLNFAPDAFVRDRVLGTTQLCSVATSGAQGHALKLALSQDGRFVVFSSTSSVLAPPDSNGVCDVFVRDRLLATTAMVSVDSAGIQGNAASGALAELDVSADGRFVCFMSEATNLVAGDTNGAQDVFVRDALLGTTSRVSLTHAGLQANGHSFDAVISSDGRLIAFTSFATDLVPLDLNGFGDIFVRDVLAARTERASVSSLGLESNGDASEASVSPDGRFVGFVSRADNLVAGDTNQAWDAFAHDRLTRKTERLNAALSGAEPDGDGGPPSLSDEATFVAFASLASNLVPADTNNAFDTFVRRWKTSSVYCTAKTNSLGCVSGIDMAGVASASSASGFVVSARNIVNQKLGLLIYSTSGFAHVAFHGGTLCVLEPIGRTPPQTSGGSLAGADCTGTFAFDFNAWIATGVDTALTPGARVWAQYWSRDPGFAPPHSVNLTNALTFEIAP